VLVVFTFFSIGTILAWRRFNTNEMNGLTGSLSFIGDRQRVLGLDYVRRSEYIEGSPFLQIFSYAQVLHGGTVNFSFAEHHSGIVSFARPDSVPRWTPGLEWHAERVDPRDIRQFDDAIVNATDVQHHYLSTLPWFTPVTSEGRWRLYRCKKSGQAPPQ